MLTRLTTGSVDESMRTTSPVLLVYLDSKDIIDVERGTIEAELLPSLFGRAGAALVLSPTLIDEFIAPLRRREGGSVTRVMNILEATPHRWIRTVDIEGLELSSAAKAFAAGRVPIRPVPFCDSYLDTGFVDNHTKRFYRGKPLAAVVWDQAYGERNIVAAANLADRFPDVVKADRELISAWKPAEYQMKLRQKFEQKIRAILGNARSGREFVDALWSQPDWCPAARLSFESYHTFVRDKGTYPTVNDVNDFTRIMALPYVDVFTADGAKRDLLRKLKEKPELSGMEHWSRIRTLKNIHEVVTWLEKKATQLDR